MKIDPTTITVTEVGKPRTCISFVDGDARYHIWLDLTGRVISGVGRKTATLYKNSVALRGQPGHFDTRYLDAENASNSTTVATLIKLAQPKIEEARAAIQEQAEKEAAEQAKEHQRLIWLDDAIARLDSDDGREIQFNDVMTVLDFAKRMRAEGRS